MKEQTTRTVKLDNLKFFLILCVVIGHFYSAYQPMNDFIRGILIIIYSFHMPAFLFISGLFSKKVINEKKFDRVFSYLVLFLVVKYSRWLMELLTGSRTFFSYTDVPDVSWYALALIVYYLFTMWTKEFDIRYMLIFAVVVSCVSGYAKDIGNDFAIRRILTFYPFFLMGYYIKVDKLMDFAQKRSIKLLSVILMLTVGYMSFRNIDKSISIMQFFRGKYSFRLLGKEFRHLGGLMRLGWILLVFAIIIALIALTPSVKSFVSNWGSRTLSVYALHYSIVRAFYNIYGQEKWFCSLGNVKSAVLLFGIALFTTCVLSMKPIEDVIRKIIFPPKQNRR